MLDELEKFKFIRTYNEFNNLKSFLSIFKLFKGYYHILDEIEIDDEYKFLLWIDNYVPNIDINIVINELVDLEQVMLFGNKIFSNIYKEEFVLI